MILSVKAGVFSMFIAKGENRPPPVSDPRDYWKKVVSNLYNAMVTSIDCLANFVINLYELALKPLSLCGCRNG